MNLHGSYKPEKAQGNRWPTFVSLLPGDKFTAVIGGPLYTFKGHFLDKTKPCLLDMTDGELECLGCAAKRKVEDVGYLPLIDDNNFPIVIKVSMPQWRDIGSWGQHRQVEVWKEKRPNSATRVRLDKRFNTSIKREGLSIIEIDLREWVFGFWKMPELHKWWKKKIALIDKGDQKPTLKVEEAAPPTPEDQAEAKKLLDQYRKSFGKIDPPSGNKKDRVPSRNGKH